MVLDDELFNLPEKVNLEDNIEGRVTSIKSIPEQLDEELERYPTYDCILSSVNMENRTSENKFMSPMKYLVILQRAKEEEIPSRQVYEDLKDYL